MKTLNCALLFALTTMAMACSQKPDAALLESQRVIERDNAAFNAQDYRRTDPRYKECNVIPAADSTQGIDCVPGDGWATITMVCANGQYKLKCSTVSNAVGCVPESEFASKPFGREDGHCNDELGQLTKIAL